MAKKVGIVRQNNPIELDFSKASTTLRGTEYRLGVIEAMVAAGFEVQILSPVPQSHKHILKGKSQNSMDAFLEDGEERDVDYDFMSNVEYCPRKRDHSDLDFLYIECGPTNSLFSYSDDVPSSYREHFDEGKVPYIWRTFDCIDNFYGHIVFHQHDILLGFPFNEASREPSENANSKRNITVMGQSVDFHEGKEWTVLLHSLRHQTVADRYNELNRYAYDQHDISYHIIPACYSENVDLRFEPMEEPKHDLLYIGGPKDEYRKDRIAEFYNHPNHDVAIIGGWDDESRDEVGRDCIHYYGRKGSHQDVYRLQNWGMATVNVGDEELCEAGQITNRVVSSARGGSVVMIDEGMYGGNHYVDDEWLVSDHVDVNDRLTYLKELDYDERLEINETQLEQLPRWKDLDWFSIFTPAERDRFTDARGTQFIDGRVPLRGE